MSFAAFRAEIRVQPLFAGSMPLLPLAHPPVLNVPADVPVVPEHCFIWSHSSQPHFQVVKLGTFKASGGRNQGRPDSDRSPVAPPQTLPSAVTMGDDEGLQNFAIVTHSDHNGESLLLIADSLDSPANEDCNSKQQDQNGIDDQKDSP
jgi:hypothetical protein